MVVDWEGLRPQNMGWEDAVFLVADECLAVFTEDKSAVRNSLAAKLGSFLKQKNRIRLSQASQRFCSHTSDALID